MCGVAQIASIPSASAWRAIPTLSRVERAVVERGEDVAVQVDHGPPEVYPDPLQKCNRRQGANARSGTAAGRHGATMIGMIIDLLPLGLRGA